MEQMEKIYAEDPSLSLPKTAPIVGASGCTLWKILRWDMKAKFTELPRCKKITDDYKRQRRHFCEWFLSQYEDFVAKKHLNR